MINNLYTNTTQHNETLDPRFGFPENLLNWSLKHYTAINRAGRCFINNQWRRVEVVGQDLDGDYIVRWEMFSGNGILMRWPPSHVEIISNFHMDC